MPTISWFYGISIRMFFADHAPPDFHAVYGDDEALIAIDGAGVIKGALSPRALRLVRDWALMYNAELMANWTRTQARPRQPLEKIPGLDAQT
ncbi:MAG: DUF4160 domain-containing protein [Pseudomonadota bacterium]